MGEPPKPKVSMRPPFTDARLLALEELPTTPLRNGETTMLDFAVTVDDTWGSASTLREDLEALAAKLDLAGR